jgi:hypothetical protein
VQLSDGTLGQRKWGTRIMPRTGMIIIIIMRRRRKRSC